MVRGDQVGYAAQSIHILSTAPQLSTSLRKL
jgi:hypothetical protein